MHLAQSVYPQLQDMDEKIANWDHSLEHASLTDVGLRRANNQDSMATLLASSQEKWRQRGHLFVVADGMGAHAAGELASKLATDIVPLTYHKLLDRPPSEALVTAIEDANSQINSRGQASSDFRGMGTTICALLLLPQGVMTAHVGDSRIYRWRSNRLEQLTFDHSLVWELRAAGQFTGDEVPSFVPKNVITRSLGPNAHVQVDAEGLYPLLSGDTFILCSDGLSGPVKDDEIGKIVGSLPPEEAVRALVDIANLRGGPDNITVTVARVNEPAAALGNQSVGATSAPRPVNPLLWTALCVFAMATAGLAAMQHWLPALIGLAATVVIGVATLIQRYSGRDISSRVSDLPLGKGPYTACDCPADVRFTDQLLELAQQLRDAATNEDWTVDWYQFNAHEDRAITASRAADYPLAVREHCQAISFMMGQLRTQRNRNGPSDSDTSVF